MSTTPPKVILFGSLRPEPEARLRSLFDVTAVAGEADLPALPPEARRAFRAAAVGLSSARFSAEALTALPNLEIVASNGVGYEGVDVAAAARANVIVTNTPGVLNDETANTAVALLLMTARELPAAERYLRDGRWPAEGEYPLTATVIGRTVGIAGFGRIGATVARRLEAFDLTIAYHNRRPRPEVAYRYYGDLVEMAANVDTLICVLPGGEETRHLIDGRVLQALGPNGILINIGRGSAVDEEALIRALGDGTIRAAGLDVFEHEPDVPDALVALPNAVLLPHVGSGSAHTRDAMAGLVVDNLASWFDDGQPLTPVAETPWPRGG